MSDDKNMEYSLLLEKLQSQSRLASDIAHKVNNPLTYVMNYLFILKQGVEDENSRRMIDVIEDGISKATNILNNLVDISSPPKEQIQEIYLKALVDETIAVLPGKNGKLIKNNVDASSMGFAGSIGLRKALISLFENSVEAEASEIPIDSKEDRGIVTLRIKDNGQGIKEEYLQRVFEPFFTTKTGRAGLSLYASFHIIKSFGGSMWCESTGSAGSDFFIALEKSI
jgi:signal transduction histidine kinase